MFCPAELRFGWIYIVSSLQPFIHCLQSQNRCSPHISVNLASRTKNNQLLFLKLSHRNHIYLDMAIKTILRFETLFKWLETTRIDPNHPDIFHVVRACRDMCYAVHAERIRKLKALGLIAHN